MIDGRVHVISVAHVGGRRVPGPTPVFIATLPSVLISVVHLADVAIEALVCDAWQS